MNEFALALVKANKISQVALRHNKKLKTAKNILSALILLFTGISILMLSWHIATSPAETVISAIVRKSPAQSVPSPEEIDEFLARDVQPGLKAFSARNRQSVDRAKKTVFDEMNNYKGGIPAFVKDVTSWKTRFGVLGHLTRNAWKKLWHSSHDINRVDAFVSEKFDKHLFSEKDITRLVYSVMHRFQDDIQASRNRLHAEIESAWKDKFPELEQLDFDAVIAQAAIKTSSFSRKAAIDSLAVGSFSIVGGIVVEESARKLAIVIISRIPQLIAASASLSMLSSGGSVAAGAVAGGAGGSVMGPAGTVVCAGVGIGAGLAADWWMTEKFKSRLTADCKTIIFRTQTLILTGTNKHNGVISEMDKITRSLEQTEQAGIQSTLTEISE